MPESISNVDSIKCFALIYVYCIHVHLWEESDTDIIQETAKTLSFMTHFLNKFKFEISLATDNLQFKPKNYLSRINVILVIIFTSKVTYAKFIERPYYLLSLLFIFLNCYVLCVLCMWFLSFSCYFIGFISRWSFNMI